MPSKTFFKLSSVALALSASSAILADNSTHQNPSPTRYGSFESVMALENNPLITKTPPTNTPTSAVLNSTVMDATRSGRVDQVSEQALINATLSEIETTHHLFHHAKVNIFNLNNDGSEKKDGSSLTSITWNPSRNASTFISTFGQNTALLTSNIVTRTNKTLYHKDIAIIGQKANTPYMVMATNPLRVEGNQQMNQLMENAIAWLSHRDNLKDAPFNVILAQLDNSRSFKDADKTREWLDTHYLDHVNYNDAHQCDAKALSSCLNSETDLLIISQISHKNDDVEAIASTVNQALKDGIPVLYFHHDGNQKALGKALLNSVFNVQYEWDNDGKYLSLELYNPADDINDMSAKLSSIKTLFTHFKNEDYTFDWSPCIKSNCTPVTEAGTAFDDEFQQGASLIKKIMNDLDSRKQNIFHENGYHLQKLFALTADKFRQDVSFPMDKLSTDNTRFLKSYYADHAVYNYRDINPAQQDMGNFSRSDFSHITPTGKTVSLTSNKGFHSTGTYALPGQTVTLTRHDDSDVAVKVFVNTLRKASTHEWVKNGYKRPKYLKSQAMPIQSGETISFTSPYGGPIQLAFNHKDQPISVTLNNIGQHPYWASKDDNASFTQKMNAGDYDWAEISTIGFEIHSTLEKMRQSIANPKWGDAQALATATMHYMYSLPYALAGYQGPNIDPIPELHDFAENKGWTINTFDKVQHMNADQASCGAGCSGNPYDAYWAFSPVNHGDVHELGHGLQGKKRFEGWGKHAMTNYYSYYTKSQYHQDTGEDPSCDSLPFEDNFTLLQDSVHQDNPAAYVKDKLWDNNSWSKSAAMFIQMMMVAQNEGALEDGWLLRGRLHLLEHEFNRAKTSQKLWEQKRNSLGFGQYSWSEIELIDNNDWYLIATSYVTQRDFSDYFDMWAISYSHQAKAQVTALDYKMMPQQYYKSGSTDYCLSLDKTAIAVDGEKIW